MLLNAWIMTTSFFDVLSWSGNISTKELFFFDNVTAAFPTSNKFRQEMATTLIPAFNSHVYYDTKMIFIYFPWLERTPFKSIWLAPTLHWTKALDEVMCTKLTPSTFSCKRLFNKVFNKIQIHLLNRFGLSCNLYRKCK